MPPRHSGTAKLVNGQATVTATLGEPGFILCEAVYFYPESDAAGAKTKTVKALGGAGIDPLQIKPSLPVPDDFDDFWAAKKKELAAIPMNARLTPLTRPRTSPARSRLLTSRPTAWALPFPATTPVRSARRPARTPRSSPFTEPVCAVPTSQSR